MHHATALLENAKITGLSAHGQRVNKIELRFDSSIAVKIYIIFLWVTPKFERNLTMVEDVCLCNLNWTM